MDSKKEGINYSFNFIKNLQNSNPGDYLEFGVFKGGTFIKAFKKAENMGFYNMRFIAFDSFEGLPEVSNEEAKYNKFNKGQYSCSEEKFLRNIKKKGVDLSKVETVPGYFDQSLKQVGLKKKLQIKRVNVVWIDCDLYESTVPVLDFITDIIGTGTVLAFDDYFSFAGDLYTGEIRAIRE